jgi:hypothetical protein
MAKQSGTRFAILGVFAVYLVSLQLLFSPKWTARTLASGRSEPINAPAKRVSGASLAGKFGNVALDLTRDTSVSGPQTIDLYWKAENHGYGEASSRKICSYFAGLYLQLQGSRLLHARLTKYGWRFSGMARPLVLVLGQTTEALLILTNETEQPREFSVSVSGGSIKKEEERVLLVSNATDGEWIRLDPERLGSIDARVDVESNQQQVVIPLRGNVRASGKLRVRILGADGRHATPARVYVTGSDGYQHTPQGTLDRVMWMSGEHFFYSDGNFDISLPAGRASVEAVKGFDYYPAHSKVDIRPGKTTLLNLRLKPVQGLNMKSWYCGDEHIHANYEQNQSATPAEDLLVARAEGLNVANIMVANGSGSRIFDEQYFSGKPSPVSLPHCILYWNEEMRTSGFYGHLVMLNLKKLVKPIYTGFPGTPHWEDYPSNYQQAKQAKDEGAYVVYAHPALTFDKFPWGSSAGEAVADVPLGVIDAMEVFCSQEETSMALWYRFLNLGFRLGITAGSDAESLNQRYSFIPGGDRLYVYTGSDFDYARWMQGIRKGEVFATQGPLVLFQIDGQRPGHVFRFKHGPVILSGVARVASYIPIHKLEIVVNGQVAAEVSDPVPTEHLVWRGKLKFDKSAWVAARVWGPDNRLIANGPSRWEERRSRWVLLAHTGPFYVKVGDSTVYSAADRDYMLRWIDALIQKVEKDPRFASQERRDEVIETFRRARAIYVELPGKVADPQASSARW